MAFPPQQAFHQHTPLYLRHHPDLLAGCTRRACGRLAVTTLRGRRLCKVHILERMSALQFLVFQHLEGGR